MQIMDHVSRASLRPYEDTSHDTSGYTSRYTGYIDEMLYPDACDALLRLVVLRAPPLPGGEASSSLGCLGSLRGVALEEPALEELASCASLPSPSPSPSP